MTVRTKFGLLAGCLIFLGPNYAVADAWPGTQCNVASIARRVLRLALTIGCLSPPLTGYAAATYHVGTCKPGKSDFATIQQALTTAPPECASTPAAISGNVFLGTMYALNDVPAGTSLEGTAGTYSGVQTVESLCQ